MKVRTPVERMGTYDPPLEGRGEEHLLLLDFNESTMPPSAEVIEALVRVARDGKLNAYPAYTAMMERLSDYAGLPQEQVILTNGSDQALDIAIRAAKMWGDPLDHIIIYGPPGLGKTTLAHIICHEMDAIVRVTSGPAIERAGYMAAILTGLQAGECLFIDEVHRLNRFGEEVLYSSMEDCFLS